MEFNANPNHSDDHTFHPMEPTSILQDDDSPQQQINEQSITQNLEKTRESLKRKLQTRRSLKQLVDVGIMPSRKAPLPYYEQCKQLQMRKTQDILKNKIISRPDRQLLIEHNILSDTNAAPAIQQTQLQLKRARLADDLNDKIAARPGVLELVASNILEIDSDLKEAIQGGRIKFPSTKPIISPILSTPLFCPPDEQVPSSSSSTYLQQAQRPLRPKTASFANTINGQANTTGKRSVNSNAKAKSSLTFHEYKGPSQKVEVTKVPLQPTPALIVQPVQATLVPLVPLEAQSALNENHYRIQLRQQRLFLELLHDDPVNTGDAEDSTDSNHSSQDDNPIGNLLKQPIDDSVTLLPSVTDEIQSFEKMKLVDLKSECRKLNLSTTGTKMKLIEKLRNARVKMSGTDTTVVPSPTTHSDLPSTSMTHSSLPPIQVLISTPTFTDQERYQQQQQKIVELDNQLEKLKQIDPYSLQTSPLFSSADPAAIISQKCNPILSVQLQRRILMQQQEKLKQKIDGEHQHQHQHAIMPLTPEFVARFIAHQTQSQTSDNHPWSIHHSTSAPSFLPFTDNPYYPSCPSSQTEPKLVDDDAILSLLDDYTDPTMALNFPSDHSLTNPAGSCVSLSPSVQMDWMSMTSPSMSTDFYDDNNSDFTQFLNQFDNEHHLLFDSPLSTCQQSSNTHSYDLLSPSSPMI